MSAGLLKRVLRNALLSGGDALQRLASRVPMPPLPPSVLTEEEKARLRRNGVFKGRHAGRRCFVIGNGPSLAGQDLLPLGGEITFVTNSFFTHPIGAKWHPTYYVVIDPVCFEDSPAAHEYLKCIAATTAGTIYFVPLYFFKRLPTVTRVWDQELLPVAKTYFIALGGDKLLGPVTHLNPTAFLPPLLNVVQICIALALYMGCTPIYLLGLDHDWLSRPGADTHFYEKRPELEEALASRSAALLASYEPQLGISERVWRGYHMLGGLAARRRVEIKNATSGGFLDVFPRVDYQSLMR